jgi:hypothetical protein
MPEIQYPTNPNTDTAFVVQEDGKKNRALMVAPQDISTLELSNNPNSTKGYVTVDGKKHRVNLVADITGGGGGGGDQHNLGYYATQAALEEAHPTAEAGDWAIVGATDTVWIWDTDNSEWVDSDQKGQVTSVNGQTGAVTVSEVPSQTGQSGKFLTTDGTDASWATVNALQNTATGIDAVAIGGTNQGSGNRAVALGVGSSFGAQNFGVVIGYNAQGSGVGPIVIGAFSNMSLQSVQYGIVIGGNSKVTQDYAIQLGYNATNSDANTFKVANANGNFEIMSADGTIPHGRLTNALASTTVTIAVADWNGGTTVSKTVSGLTATSVVFASPDGSSMSEWASAGVYASGQATDTLTFTASSTPTASITVVVAYC